jgi:peptide methionine sulfoxide reductase msrA/msrB
MRFTKFLFLISIILTTIYGGETMYKTLTPFEKWVIEEKGTERPFSGKYYEHKEDGTYTCKKCGTALYSSKDKFDSHCGWPSFDDEIQGAIKRVPDKDGRRVEIVCANCGGHLGHVFEGEMLTKKNIRHCVNSVSIDFQPTTKKNIQKAYFAGGCFWGVEYYFEKQDGVLHAISGYMGGKTKDPTYKEVCYSDTGHIESVEVTFDADIVDFESLAKLFFEIHDPTQKNRQGPDIGEQYQSAIFYTNEIQKKTSEKLIEQLKKNGYEVQTKLIEAPKFYEAEDYHQNYYNNNGKQPYCHIYSKRF